MIINSVSIKNFRCYYGEITAEEECQINKALAVNLSLPYEAKHDNYNEEEIEHLKACLDSAIEANQGYEEDVKTLEREIEDLKEKLMAALSEKDIEPSNEGNIYKNLYHELLDKILRIKLQEEK